MKNTIANRVNDFLKKFPPFDIIDQENLLNLSKEVTIIYLEKGKIVFNEQDHPHDYFYIVKEGAIEMRQTVNDNFEMVDICDEGDVFGVRPIITNTPYQMSAIAQEESIIYGIPSKDFRPLIEKDTKIGLYLIEIFASKTRNPYSIDHTKYLYQNFDRNMLQKDFFELQPAVYVKKVVKASPEESIQQIATLMTEKRVSSIVIVDADKKPLGIVTDKDLRKQIATSYFSLDMQVSQVMSSPVRTYPKQMTIAKAQFEMIKNNINHLIITEDGTNNTPTIGIMTQHDIETVKGDSIPELMKAVKRSKKSKHLKSIRQQSINLLKGYVIQNIPLGLITDLFHQLFEAITSKAIELCIKRMPTPPPVRFAWVSLGSLARKEQFLITDQDNAIVFEDVTEEHYEQTQTYFLQLANKINTMLNKIGYDYCPANMMAKNPNWCLSLSKWEEQFKSWVSNANDADLLMFSIFYDMSFSFGEATLVNKLSDKVFEFTQTNERFMALLAKSALENPSPLGFFRNFIVEHDGKYKDQFDLKARALTTISDIARLLALSHKIKNITNTAERFEKLAELEPQNKEIFLACAYAAKALLKFRIKSGLKNDDSGRYLNIKNLNKEEKTKLKRCFKTISNAQELIKLRFKLNLTYV
ncbi:DUF294 nucleotidyltransferase-like domain-containing protein [Capnocytophaga canis]|uniref:Putative lysophospholipase n=1 Tax=Capnocytophaga canis TaxID=1848903 RepID=A0A0B7HZV5_9FLAO|nr:MULTISPECIES: DUF294 nucleotidyltransferase-like domain-containing protein [Capnocytophaga]ATA72286.1 nucleotidyltransferase [Capnocytophaga sp. H4358]CEN43058.1 putative lysophospholipase [Capnocytophaga canis]